MARTNGRREVSDDCVACAGFSLCSLVLAVIALSITIIVTSVHKLSANQNGIMYDNYGRRFKGVHTPGLYSSIPFSRFIVFPGIYKNVDVKATCVTSDGLFVNLDVGFQYLPKLAALESIARAYRNQDKYDSIVVASATSAIHQVCSDYNVTDFQNVRPLIQKSMGDAIEARLSAINASALSTQLVNIGVPDAWNQAVFNKQQAEQDIALAGNQRAQQVSLAQLTLSLAEQDATINLQGAAANATIIVNTALQQAEAIVARFLAATDAAVALQDELKLKGADIIPLLENRLIRSTAGVDIALPNPVDLTHA